MTSPLNKQKKTKFGKHKNCNSLMAIKKFKTAQVFFFFLKING